MVELSDNQGWIEYPTQEFAFGISLALVIASLSFNVRIVRQMGVDPRLIKRSQMLLILTATYALLVFGLEMI